jgi:uncharacterized protein (DUF305 family)
MAELVDARSKRLELRTLADRIAASQGREIGLMQGWLQAWGKPAAPQGTDHGGMHMPGMMSEAEMRRLMATRHQDFDLLFLEMMTAHHQGAIEMANTELGDGSLPEVKRLAQQIIDDQQAEINQFEQWQKEWATARRSSDRRRVGTPPSASPLARITPARRAFPWSARDGGTNGCAEADHRDP